MPPGRFFNCRGAFSICNPSPSSTTMPFEHLMEPTIKIALIGAGMFGGDVHARAYADLQRAGISPQLGRVGLDHWAREFASIQFQLVAVATRTPKSARRGGARCPGARRPPPPLPQVAPPPPPPPSPARRAQQNFKLWTSHQPKAY